MEVIRPKMEWYKTIHIVLKMPLFASSQLFSSRLYGWMRATYVSSYRAKAGMLYAPNRIFAASSNLMLSERRVQEYWPSWCGELLWKKNTINVDLRNYARTFRFSLYSRLLTVVKYKRQDATRSFCFCVYSFPRLMPLLCLPSFFLLLCVLSSVCTRICFVAAIGLYVTCTFALDK